MAKKKSKKKITKKASKVYKMPALEPIEETQPVVTPTYVTKEPEPTVYTPSDITDSYPAKVGRNNDTLVLIAFGIAVFIGFLLFCI